MYSPSIRRATLRACTARRPTRLNKTQLRWLSAEPALASSPSTSSAAAVEHATNTFASEPTALVDVLTRYTENYTHSQAQDGDASLEHAGPSRRLELRMDGGARDLPTFLAAVHEVERRFGKIRDYLITTVSFSLFCSTLI